MSSSQNRRRNRWAVLALITLAVSLAPWTMAEDTPERPRMKAFRIDAPPTLDGDVLNDAAWAKVEPASGFVQTAPDDGEPASEKTEAFIAYDATTLYVGVVCYDDDPESIVVSDARRDASLANTDSLQVVFDTYNDLQSGFLFGTNPAGIEYDGQVTRDGEVQFGTTGGFNLNWDGAWEVATKIHDQGWSAEFAIPFQTLRFPKGSPQDWGINFQRNIRDRKEFSFWAPMPRQFDLDRVSRAGRLEGVEVPTQQFLQAVPYARGDSVRGADGFSGSEEDFDGGVDVKFGVTPNMTVDLTINTDFAEVEADVQQLNLDRFNLFFPERRPFFLENAGTFRVGLPGQVELFQSRRIGIGANGEEIPIRGGVRLSGKTGRTNVGAVYMLTDDTSSGVPENEFAVLRLSRDIGENSSIGIIATSRDASGSLASEDDYGRTYGIDGRWSINPQAELNAFVARTDTPGAVGDEHAFSVGGRWNSEKLLVQGSYAEVGEGFSPEVGFLTRRNYRRPEIYVLTRHRSKDWKKFQEYRPHIFYQGYWDFDGFKEQTVFHAGVHWEWKNGYEIHTGFNVWHDGVKDPFEISRGVIIPAQEFSRTELQIDAFTDLGRPVSFRLFLVAGEFFDGDRVSIRPTFRFRKTEKFTGEIAWRHDNINLPFGDFDADLGRLRLAYAFTPKLFVESLFQYNTAADQWSSNVRFGWRHTANTGLFLVYNDIEEIGRSNFENQRQLIIKYSRLVEIFSR
ncbi:MAG: DUF5916 domain-containing protein [Acidobacteriota bacterium]